MPFCFDYNTQSLGFPFVTLYLLQIFSAGSGRGRPYPALPSFFTTIPRPYLLSYASLSRNERFLSQYRILCQDFGESRLQKSCKIPYPSKHLAFSRIPLYICQIPDSNNRTIGEGGSWSRIPAPFSRQSRIPTISHLYPEYRFLSQQYTASRATILANPASRKAVRSHIRSRHFALYFLPNSALYLGQFPDPESTFQDPVLKSSFCEKV